MAVYNHPEQRSMGLRVIRMSENIDWTTTHDCD